MIDYSQPIKIAVACPSYRRPRCRTAEYIPETRIYIDASDEADYREANQVGEIVVCPDGVQGNLPRVRNYILDTEFGNGADVVVMMDDDINHIGFFKPEPETGFGYKKCIIDHDMFYDFVQYGSILCDEWGFGMWGIGRDADPLFYQQMAPFSTTRCAVGQFMVFTKNELRFDEELPLKEDYDMCLQQLKKYRGVLTIRWAYHSGDFAKLAGGTSIRRNFNSEFEQYKRFKRKWGSDIVGGVALEGGKGKSHGETLDYYNFSLPKIKQPIAGI